MLTLVVLETCLSIAWWFFKLAVVVFVIAVAIGVFLAVVIFALLYMIACYVIWFRRRHDPIEAAERDRHIENMLAFMERFLEFLGGRRTA